MVQLTGEGMCADVEVSATVGELTAQNIWTEKQAWEEDATRSMEKWMTMTDEEREAVLGVMDRTLDRLRDTMEEWVPPAMLVGQGQYLDLRVRMLFTDLEAEQRSRVEISERKIREAVEDTARLIGESTE